MLALISYSAWKDDVMDAIRAEKSRTTIVLIAVATVESVSFIPHLARIEVMPAKNAEPTANKQKIAELLKNGVPFQYAHLEQGRSLRIREWKRYTKPSTPLWAR